MDRVNPRLRTLSRGSRLAWRSGTCGPCVPRSSLKLCLSLILTFFCVSAVGVAYPQSDQTNDNASTGHGVKVQPTEPVAELDKVWATLKNSPKKCVSLSPGQVCTERVLIEWQTQIEGHFCLFSSHLSNPMACWESAAVGEHRFVFESATDMIFTLVNMNAELLASQQILASSSIVVAWVYRKKRGSGRNWRSIWKVF